MALHVHTRTHNTHHIPHIHTHTYTSHTTHSVICVYGVILCVWYVYVCGMCMCVCGMCVFVCVVCSIIVFKCHLLVRLEFDQGPHYVVSCVYRHNYILCSSPHQSV